MEEPKQMRMGMFLLVLLVCFGVSYIGNLVGIVLMRFTGDLTGIELANPLNSVIENMDIWMIVLTTVLIAPVMEELMFRKYLVDRLVPYGQKTAVVLSGVIFGLFHGNFYQFFYATALGMIFAYLYSTTGRIRYNILLHMIINTVGGVISVLLMRGLQQEIIFAQIGMVFLGMGMIFSMIAALVILILCIRKLPWFSGWKHPEQGIVHTVLTAPGMWGLLIMSVFLFLM